MLHTFAGQEREYVCMRYELKLGKVTVVQLELKGKGLRFRFAIKATLEYMAEIVSGEE